MNWRILDIFIALYDASKTMGAIICSQSFPIGKTLNWTKVTVDPNTPHRDRVLDANILGGSGLRDFRAIRI
jgi:hypothetical protein